jgi:hypothetical protein
MEPKTHSIAASQGVQQLVPQGSGEIALTPDREVLCVHRGDEPYEDMFDGRPYKIQPGFFMTQYGAALHFKARAVVPGTRNPETRREASFIAIVGAVELKPDGTFRVLKAVDDAVEWTPFTAEERHDYEGKLEALDRDGMVNPIDSDVTIVSTNEALAGRGGRDKPARPSRIAGAKGSGKGGRGRGTQIETTDAEVLTPIPPEENSVVREARTAAAQAAAEGHRSE